MNKVAVLCRGKSLAGINFLPDDLDLCIIVNRFGHELEIQEVDSYLNGKEIHHIVTRTPGESDLMVQRKYYDKYKIKKVVQPYTIHMKNPKDFHDGNNKYFKFIDDEFYFCGAEKPIPAEWLGDNHIEYMDDYQRPKYPHHYPSCGNAAIGYVVLDLKPKKLYIIGMDFYDADYLAESGPGGPEDGNKMKDSLTRLINGNGGVKFTVITCGDYNHESDNLEIIKLKEE